MNNDMTFCANDCSNVECEWHKSHAPSPKANQSYEYLAQTEYCPWSIAPKGEKDNG